MSRLHLCFHYRSKHTRMLTPEEYTDCLEMIEDCRDNDTSPLGRVMFEDRTTIGPEEDLYSDEDSDDNELEYAPYIDRETGEHSRWVTRVVKTTMRSVLCDYTRRWSQGRTPVDISVSLEKEIPVKSTDGCSILDCGV